MTAFEEFGVLPEIAKAVDEMEWNLPTDIQSEAIPLILGGGDVLLAAETGSGKTGAFSLPVIQIVWETLKDQESGKIGKGGSTSGVQAKWQMNPYDRDPALAIGTDGVTCQARENSWHGTRCMKGVNSSGKYYYECVINMTLPPTDEKTNYVHRIGRVGRAERMGLAINIVSQVPEKVWYHGCPSRGKSCQDARLTQDGGCAIWYNEQQYLAAIEEHLGVTVSQIETDMKVPADEFDGKVTYGQKRAANTSQYKGHVEFLAPTVKELAHLEQQAQTSFLQLQHNTWLTAAK